jgi:hypothetical protein
MSVFGFVPSLEHGEGLPVAQACRSLLHGERRRPSLGAALFSHRASYRVSGKWAGPLLAGQLWILLVAHGRAGGRSNLHSDQSSLSPTASSALHPHNRRVRRSRNILRRRQCRNIKSAWEGGLARRPPWTSLRLPSFDQKALGIGHRDAPLGPPRVDACRRCRCCYAGCGTSCGARHRRSQCRPWLRSAGERTPAAGGAERLYRPRFRAWFRSAQRAWRRQQPLPGL